MTKIAIIRVRGDVGLSKEIRDTMKMLRLYKKNTCIVIDNSPNNIGMVEKIKDYVTWGELDQETFTTLLKERGKIVGKQKITEEYLKEKLKLTTAEFVKEFFESKKRLRDIPGLKPFFRLKPPAKGFERGGIKTPFSLGGALGYRKEKINDLVRRMI